MKLFCAALAVVCCLGAQTTKPDADPVFLAAAGASYNQVGSPQTAGWTSVAFAAIPGLYSITTLDQTLRTSSLRTGLAKKIAAKGNWIFLLHADAGLTVSTLGVTANAVGSFSGGPMIAYKIPKLRNLYAVGVVRLVAVTSVAVKPVYELGFGWGF